MSNTKIKHFRTLTPGLAPSVTNLELGEFAFNVPDGIVYIKKDDGTESIIPVGALVTETTPTLSTNLDAGGNAIVNLVDPVNPQDAATRAYVDAVVASILNAPPAALDTLDELAAALGDDPNFATTVTTQLGLKANTADLSAVAFSGDYNDLINTPTIPVLSVNGQTGNIVLDTDDVGEGTTNFYYTETRFDTSFGNKDSDDLSEGSTNLFFTNARVAAAPAVAANTAKVSADGSIDTHSDVDTTTNAPSTDQALIWDGSNWVPGEAGQFTEVYTSSDLIIISGGTVTVAHGLSITPVLIVAQLVCVSNDGGYSPGDVLNYEFIQGDKDKKGASIVADATDITIKYGNDSKAFQLIRKNNGNSFEINNNEWRLRVTAYG